LCHFRDARIADAGAIYIAGQYSEEKEVENDHEPNREKRPCNLVEEVMAAGHEITGLGQANRQSLP
jgi:hypothetical protein